VSDAQQFDSPEIGFSLRKPASWYFVPTSWSAADWKNCVHQPFCVARQMHESQEHAFPSLQATVRPFGNPTAPQADALLQMQIDAMRKTYGEVEVLEARADHAVSGHRALGIRAVIPLAIPILTRVHVIFAPGRAFSVGISTSPDPEYFDEAEIARIFESMRVYG
jgi:hypothetical protein